MFTNNSVTLSWPVIYIDTHFPKALKIGNSRHEKWKVQSSVKPYPNFFYRHARWSGSQALLTCQKQVEKGARSSILWCGGRSSSWIRLVPSDSCFINTATSVGTVHSLQTCKHLVLQFCSEAKAFL